ncbi:hypothetical protein FQN60_002571 [Etheostoma spectabile]|uniref:Uncharacterized protein n=1 Tax=Etheostoma spectabile TaxID=54343 RepID=A0A5J5CA35_9PERO|nr:hypothetical protein FQN60_002571 [Etheostoma spectabile]
MFSESCLKRELPWCCWVFLKVRSWGLTAIVGRLVPASGCEDDPPRPGNFLHYSSVNSPSCGGEIGPKTASSSLSNPKTSVGQLGSQEEDLDFSASQNEEEVNRIRATCKTGSSPGPIRTR